MGMAEGACHSLRVLCEVRIECLDENGLAGTVEPYPQFLQAVVPIRGQFDRERDTRQSIGGGLFSSCSTSFC